MITAKEFAKENLKGLLTYTEMSEKLIEFAKLHVEAALQAAVEDAPCGSSTDTVSCEDMKDAILFSYPLTNIK